MYTEPELKQKSKKEVKEKHKHFFHQKNNRLFTTIEQKFRNYTNVMFGLAILEVVLGIIFVIFPGMAIKALGILIGLVLLIQAGFQVYFFLDRKGFKIFRYSILYAVLSAILGLVFCFLPSDTFYLLTICFGIYLLVSSVEQGIMAFELFRIHEKSASFLFVSAVLGIFMSVLLFINPFAHLLLAEVLGAFLILKGILLFTDMNMLKNRARAFLDNFE